MDTLIGHSITYRIATGPRQGRKVLTLQSLPAIDEPFTTRAGNVAGFSLHVGVAAKAHERDKLERLCRYITRPAVSEKRLSLTEHGQVRYTLKNPWRDGTTHVTALAHPALAALVHPCTSSSSRWISSHASPPWCLNPASTSPVSTACSHPTANTGQPCRHDMGTPKVGPLRGRLKRVFTKSRRFRRHRHHHLPGLRWCRQGDYLHRRSGGHQEDPRPHRRYADSRCLPAARTPPQAALFDQD